MGFLKSLGMSLMIAAAVVAIAAVAVVCAPALAVAGAGLAVGGGIALFSSLMGTALIAGTAGVALTVSGDAIEDGMKSMATSIAGNFTVNNMSSNTASTRDLADATKAAADAAAAAAAGVGILAFEQAAIQARDVAIEDARSQSNKKRNDSTTIAAGYNKRTGDVTVGINKTSVNHGLICAEDMVVAQLMARGASLDDIVMTPAIRPRNMEVIPVCRRCQSKYSRSNFMPGTPYEPGRAWDLEGR